MADTFNALVLTRHEGHTQSSIKQLQNADLPEGDVIVAVDYSSLNFKDGLAITGRGKIVRNWPMVPGIDLAGTVLESDSPDYRPGDAVLATGYGLGEQYWGGCTQRQRLRGDWLVPMPEGLDSLRAMKIGTAGFAAMLCVMALEEGGVKPDDGPVLVTGASGGVGSFAVALLAQLGYTVAAVTGKPTARERLTELGAGEFLSREEMTTPTRPLEKQRWAGAIDNVGGDMLAHILAEIDYDGCVAACGLAGSADLPTTVMPFILRNIRLQGVSSVMCPKPRRLAAWQRLATTLPAAALEKGFQIASLGELPALAEAITDGRIDGRVVVDVNR